MNEERQETIKSKEKQETESSNENVEEVEVEAEAEEENEKVKETKTVSQIEGYDKPRAMSVDKAVSTYGIPDFQDYQRAVTYEYVFNSLLEKKMLAMKKDCEERKKTKRFKRKSIGRIFFAKRLFNSMDSRKTSSLSEMAIEEEIHAKSEPSTPQKTMNTTTIKTAAEEEMKADIEKETIIEKQIRQRLSTHLTRTRSKSKTNTASQEGSTIQIATQPTEQQHSDDSLTSTLSSSSDKMPVKQSLLVMAQTHRPQEAFAVSSSSGDSKNAPTTSPSNGNQTFSIIPPLSVERSHDTTSLASGYENGAGARLHSSTMADGSLTSLRDSIESISFTSSRCTVSFGATEVIPPDTDVNIYERIKAAKRQRILDAKSISAQCSPILQPHHLIKSLVHAPMSPSHLKQTTVHPIIATTASSIPNDTTTSFKVSSQQPRFVPNQYSYAESIFESRNISRQNTSEDSANLTVSSLLNQSDSLSLHAPAHRRPFTINERFKSKSTSLLQALSNGRTRPPPPPLPPPLFETVQHSPTTNLALPIEQLQQLHLTSNIRHNIKPKFILTTDHTSSSFTARKPEPASVTRTVSAAAATSAPSLHTVSVSTTTTTMSPKYPLNEFVDTTAHMDASLPSASPTPSIHTAGLTSTIMNGAVVVNGAIVSSSSVIASDTEKLHRMTSTSTGSSIGPTTGCCTTTKSTARVKEKQRFKPQVAMGQSGSDDEYHKKKRKYKRYHRCSDPVLVYPTPSGLQHCILSMPPNEPIQYPYTEDYAFDVQLQIESDKNDDLEKIVPSESTKRKHHKHRHHRHKKRHRHKKPKILVQDLETQEVKVIDPDDLPQRARWTIIATACLLLLMCLMLVGITLRMAPIIDDMDETDDDEEADRKRKRIVCIVMTVFLCLVCAAVLVVIMTLTHSSSQSHSYSHHHHHLTTKKTFTYNRDVPVHYNVRQENERLMKETMDRARFGKNYTETASSLLAATTSTLTAAAAAASAAAGGAHHYQQQLQAQQQHNQQQILLPQPQPHQYPLPHFQQIP